MSPKEALLETVWPETFVGDDVLKGSISELRHVLGDDAREPRFIETIPKRGYRLLPAVTPANGSSGSEDSGSASLDRRQAIRRNWKLIGSAVTGLIVLFGLLFAFNVRDLRGRLFGGSSPLIRSLAVLPLQNLSGDPSQEYFSDGMTEELITELSRISGMKVISRTSVMRYKNSNKSLPEIARELGVDGIVEGSVLRSGERVRITAQLIFARTDGNVWAETYDRDLRDVIALQAAVAGAIASKIRATMIPSGAGPSKTHTMNLKALEAYLRGIHEDNDGGGLSNRHGMQQAAAEHHRRAVEYYKEAIKEDPNFAPAYLGSVADNTIEGSEAAARKALEIDDSLSDGHLLLGSIELVRDHNWQDAEREITRAIELNPNNATAHHAYAYFLDATGRLEEGMKEWERAQELDPATDHLAGAFYSRRQYDRLIELERDELARNTEGNAYVSAVAHKTLMVAYARLGKQKESIEAFRLALSAYGYNALAEDLRRGYVHGGYEGALREWLKGVQREKPDFPFPWVSTYVYTELGERDAALARLPKMETSYEVVAWQSANVFPNLVTLRIEPMWDPLHSDPRFEELVARVGFPRQVRLDEAGKE